MVSMISASCSLFLLTTEFTGCVFHHPDSCQECSLKLVPRPTLRQGEQIFQNVFIHSLNHHLPEPIPFARKINHHVFYDIRNQHTSFSSMCLQTPSIDKHSNLAKELKNNRKRQVEGAMIYSMQLLKKDNNKGTNIFRKLLSHLISEITYNIFMLLLNKQIIFTC